MLILHSLLSPVVGHLQCVQFFIIFTIRPCTYFTGFFISLLDYLFPWGVFCKEDSVVKDYEPFYRAC